MKNILLIFGGTSFEHDVSIRSYKNFYNYIDQNKFNVESIYITKENEWFLIDDVDTLKYDRIIDNIIDFIKNFDCVVSMIHGYGGEDGKLQSLFELFDINYIGSNSISSTLCMNKELTKLILKENNIEQVDYLVYESIKDVEKNLGYPVIVKPSNGGSSIGIKIANNKKELKNAIKNARVYHNKIIVEKFIEDRKELECAVISYNGKIYASTIGEIIPMCNFYDYDDKYVNNNTLINIPSDINKNTSNKIKSMAIKAFKLLNCNDFARVDFLIDNKTNKIYLNEVNTIPGFTDISMFNKLLEYDKYNLKDLISKIIKSKSLMK